MPARSPTAAEHVDRVAHRLLTVEIEWESQILRYREMRDEIVSLKHEADALATQLNEATSSRF